MKRIPPIKTVMTPFPTSVDVADSLETARSMMRELEIRHLPVTEEGRLVSVISDRDIRLAIASSPEPGAVESVPVRELCVSEAYIVDMATPLDQVLRHLSAHHLGAALVVKEGRLAGIFTTSDACRSFGNLLTSLFPSGNKDDAA